MNALVARRYGSPDVVMVREVPDPVVGPRDVVVRVHATTVSSGDARLRAARFPTGFGLLGRLLFGVFKPRRPVLGVELAGFVDAVGSEVTEHAVGDRVLAMTGDRMGAHAERCVVSVDHCVVALPDDVSFEDAVTLPFGGTTALTFLQDRAQVQPGDRVLVIGASGAVGTAAVQVARLLGAQVTGVCSAANAPLVRSLGAERVIDYATTDVFAGSEQWDVVIDTIGRASLAQCRRVATPNGRIGLVAGGLPQLLAAPLLTWTSRQRIGAGPAAESPAHLARLVEWLRTGAYRPVVDRRLPWQQGAEAHTRVDSQRKVGSVVLTFEAA
ncbi:MAG: NAD(P)-dependent alcohol dehydrogenase [Myxococcales bacterium]|nr:NAD(P)-dependent alcohol dehydrogenase [Myxococcales bacterium]